MPTSTIADDLMDEVVARLRGYSGIGVDVEQIRRDHRTVLARDQCPAIHVIDGTEDPKNGKGCRCDVSFAFRVAIFVRDDAGYAAAAAIKVPVMAALDPTVGSGYGHNARLNRGRITSDQEIADADSLRVDMEFQFRYETAEWRLDE